MTHRMWVSMDWFCWENLNRKPVVFNVFTIKYRGFRLKFSHHPILWEWDFDHQLLTKTARWRKIEVTYSESLQSPLKKHMAGGKKNRPNSVLSQWIIHRYPRTTNVWTPQPDIPSFLRVWIFVRPFWVSHKGISLWICDLRVFIRVSSDGFPASGSPAWAMDRENLWRVPRSGQPSPLWHYHTFEKCQEKFLHLSVKSNGHCFLKQIILARQCFEGKGYPQSHGNNTLHNKNRR